MRMQPTTGLKRANLREQLLGEILDYEQETQTLANAIKAKTELLRIENEAQIKRILAEAERAANVTVAEAENMHISTELLH